MSKLNSAERVTDALKTISIQGQLFML